MVKAVGFAILLASAVPVAAGQAGAPDDWRDRPFTFLMTWWQNEGLRPNETENYCVVGFFADHRSPRWFVDVGSFVDLEGVAGFGYAGAVLHLSVLGDGSQPEQWQWFIQEEVMGVLDSRLQHLRRWSPSRRSFDSLCQGMSPSAYDCALAAAVGNRLTAPGDGSPGCGAAYGYW